MSGRHQVRIDSSSSRDAAAAPVRITPDSVLYLEPGDLAHSLAAAILKKRIPVLLTIDRARADFFVQSVSTAGTRANLVWAGNALHVVGSTTVVNTTVAIRNRDGLVVFVQSPKQGPFQGVAERVATELGRHVERP